MFGICSAVLLGLFANGAISFWFLVLDKLRFYRALLLNLVEHRQSLFQHYCGFCEFPPFLGRPKFHKSFSMIRPNSNLKNDRSLYQFRS